MQTLLLSALLVVQAAAACQGGCSGHGSCGLLGTCICEGNWAGRDCSFQLSLDPAEIENTPLESVASAFPPEKAGASVQFLAGREDTSQAFASPTVSSSSLHILSDQLGKDSLKIPKRSGALAFAQARRAARDAWAAADRLFAAAKQENSRDADERVKRAIEQARGKKESVPGHEFAGMQAPAAGLQANQQRLCESDCNNQGLCISGKCLCNGLYHGSSCQHRRCQNDCSGNGECFQGQCQCSASFAGEDCSHQLRSTPSFASMLSLGLAAEKEQLEKQQSHGQKIEKACALNCDGHGSCHDGVCKCHDGWSGPACQDYVNPAPVALGQVMDGSCVDPLCSGKGVCQSGVCTCSDGFSGETCEHSSQVKQADTRPLQLQLQQVTEEDKLTYTCLGGCGDHGSCKAGMCECEPGWQGTSCGISAEAALRGPASSDEELESQLTLARVPTAASWIASEVPQASDARPRALRAAGQESKLASLLTSSATAQQESKHTSQPSSMGATAATALHSLFSSAVANKDKHVHGLAALLTSVIAAPED